MKKSLINILIGSVWVAGGLAGSASTSLAQGHRLEGPGKTRWATEGREREARLMKSRQEPSKGREASISVLGAANVAGAMKQLLVPVSFADEPFSYNVETVANLYYGQGSATKYSMPQFYKEASRGIFTVAGTVVAPVKLPGTRRYYTGLYNPRRFDGVGDSLDVFMKDILTALDKAVDLAPYADSADPGRRIAALVILQPSQGGECRGEISGGLWAHRYSISALLGQAFVSQDRQGGQSVLIDDYILQAAEDCGKRGVLGGIGTVAHETGHLLGLPDLYNTNSGSNDNPVGFWDLMGTGNYYTPDTPAQLGAWSRWVLGWSAARQLNIPATDTVNVSIKASVATGDMVLIPFEKTTEFLLLETRTQTGSDRNLPGAGLLVWQIDPEVITERALSNNTVNTLPDRLGVALLQADGKDDLGEGRNQGDGGDIFPGSSAKTELGPNTTPAWRGRNGQVIGALLNIGYNQSSMVSSFKLAKAGSATSDSSWTDTPLGPLMILPKNLPRGIAGAPYSATLTVLAMNGASYSVSWSADTAKLAAIGLSLSSNGILTGRLRENARTTTFSVTAKVTGGGQSGGQGGEATLQKTYVLDILANPKVGLDRLVEALTNGPALGALEILFYDGNGNKNGKFDLGDIVLALRRGLIEWMPGTIIPKL